MVSRFGTIDNGLMIASLMNPSVGFEAPKLSWVGSMAKELQICMTWHASRFHSIDDMRGAEAVFGATGRDDIRYTSTNVLRRVSGAKIKIVTGYPGTNDIRLALERGEIDGVCESWSSIKATKPDWLEQKKINIIVQFSFQEHPELPGVPPIGNFAGSPTQADALRLIFSSAETGRPFGAPPAIPADRLNALRRAFDATMKDPEFVAFTTKAKFDVEPSTGEQTASLPGAGLRIAAGRHRRCAQAARTMTGAAARRATSRAPMCWNTKRSGASDCTGARTGRAVSSPSQSWKMFCRRDQVISINMRHCGGLLRLSARA